MNKEILVRIKTVYGNDLIYPVCDNAQKFAVLTNKKTLSKNELAYIKALGFEVKVEAPVL